MMWKKKKPNDKLTGGAPQCCQCDSKRSTSKEKITMKTTFKINLETCIFVEAENEEDAMEVAEFYLNRAYDHDETENEQYFHNTNYTSIEKVSQETIKVWNALRQNN
jgi:hypothetical protein